MTENMINSLIVTAVGMGITFTAIILLWGLMAGLTAIPFKGESVADSPEPTVVDDLNLKMKAAALAVAVALAEQELSVARPLQEPPTALVSAWQLGTRSRQLYEKGKRR